jgi:hypothetical protein
VSAGHGRIGKWLDTAGFVGALCHRLLRAQASTDATLVVVVWLVVSTITAFGWTNSE